MYGIFIRGTARGSRAALGTGTTVGVIGMVALVLLWLYFIVNSYQFGRPAFIALGGGIVTLYALRLVKRFAALPDSYSIAYLSPQGLGQADALPRWPVLDPLVFGISQSLTFTGIILMQDGLLKHPLVVTAFAIVFAGFVITVVIRQAKNARLDPSDEAMTTMVSWEGTGKVTMRPTENSRMRLRIPAPGLRGVHIEFDCDPDEASTLMSALRQCQAAAVKPRRPFTWLSLPPTAMPTAASARGALNSFLARFRRDHSGSISRLFKLCAKKPLSLPDTCTANSPSVPPACPPSAGTI